MNIAPRIIGNLFLSKIIGKIGSHDWTQVTREITGQIAVFLSHNGTMVAIIFHVATCSDKHALSIIDTVDAVNVGHQLADRE